MWNELPSLLNEFESREVQLKEKSETLRLDGRKCCFEETSESGDDFKDWKFILQKQNCLNADEGVSLIPAAYRLNGK